MLRLLNFLYYERGRLGARPLRYRRGAARRSRRAARGGGFPGPCREQRSHRLRLRAERHAARHARGRPPPVPTEKLTPAMFVGDVVTKPEIPPLIAGARALGCKNSNGVAMFEKVRDLMIEGPPAPLRARLYVPEGASTGLLVHFHGGGWIIGDIDFEDRACRSVARGSGVKVLSVDYRLAPETLFPGPVEDCVRAIRCSGE